MKYVYMIGIKPSDWTFDDTKACKKYHIQAKGYYEIGNIEGMVLVGELDDLENIMEMYFGLEIVDEYLCPIDEFDFEDGRWISGSWTESKKSSGKSIKEERENNFKVSFPNNKEVLTFIKPMEHGLVTAQLMTDVGGNWAWVNNPIFEESGYMYIRAKASNFDTIQYDFAKVNSIDIDWGNHQIYFYTKGDVLMLHFYNLSDEEFKFLIYGDEHLDGIVSRFGK